MTKFGVGQPALRSEDIRFLTGKGRYVADISLPNQAWGAVTRSPHAHADIQGIDASRARAIPGVLAVIVAADLESAGIGGIPCLSPLTQRDGRPIALAPRSVLAEKTVRHVGDPVAFVVAETEAAAREAAELVEVKYAPQTSATDTATALSETAQALWPTHAPGNIAFDWEKGDATAVERAFQEAAHVVELPLINNRVIPNPLECRAAIGTVEAGTGRMTLIVPRQGVHALRQQLARYVFRAPEQTIRVITPDVGGGFGVKIFLYPEYALVLFAARQLGRPVKWVATRSESFVSDNHGRDHVTLAALALDVEGRFLALRADINANMGAYLSAYGPYIPTEGCTAMLAGCYKTPAIYARVRGVYTNTQPVDAYRGAGRPEAAYIVERLVDVAARRLQMDPAALRRPNFISPESMPYATPLGETYDCGDFARTLDDALALADAAGFSRTAA
ncbi:hypothetical protein CCP2SC5_950013 [Azospirillaceae bacterium]